MVKCERQSIDTRALFVFIGAVPNTVWLAGTIELDDHGFIPTGPAALYSDGDGEKRRRSGASRRCWKPASPVCSRRVTCAVAR